MAHNMDQPMAVLHVEETQVERFQMKIRDIHGVVVENVESPLLFVQCENNSRKNELESICKDDRIATHRIYHITSLCNDPEWLMWSDILPKHATFRVVAYPNNLQPKLMDLLRENGWNVHPTKHTHELHVVLSRSNPQYHFGVLERPKSKALQRVNTAPCRAYFKLEEALKFKSPFPTGTRAIDIGASPGGWTEFLSSNGAKTVVAIDPGVLTIPVDGKSIIHLQMLVEDAIVHHLPHMDKFHLCVCDINVRPPLMAQLIRSVAPFLNSGATVVLTLKLGRRPTTAVVNYAVEEVKKTLDGLFTQFTVRWLHANTINERTLFAERI